MNSNHIPTLPPEILADIFARLSRRNLVRASHTCGAWRAAATGNAALWASMTLSERDAKHLEVVRWQIARAATRDLDINVQFVETADATDINGLINFLRPLLERCAMLGVRATVQGWRALLDGAIRGRQLQRMRVLDLDIVSMLASPVDVGHDLKTTQMPNLHTLRIAGNIALVDDNGRILPNIIREPLRCLELRDVNCIVPALSVGVLVDAPAVSSPSPGFTTLKLVRPRAVQTNMAGNADCAPFLDALHTQLGTSIEDLTLDGLCGRVWEDFLFALPAGAYPQVRSLNMRDMDLRVDEEGEEEENEGEDGEEEGRAEDAALKVLLRAFPSLERLRLEDCPPGTVQAVKRMWVTGALDVVRIESVLMDGEAPENE